MLLHDIPGQGESEAGALSGTLRREERIEDPAKVLLEDPAAVVVDGAASNWDRWRFVIRILPIDDIEACAAEAARILQLAGYTIPESTVTA